MSHVVSAEIVANVLSVAVHPKQQVGATDAVTVLQSVKMGTPVLAAVAGTVTEVVVTTGDAVHDGDPLVVISEA